MRGEIHINVVQLFLAPGLYRDRDRDVVTFTTVPGFNRSFIDVMHMSPDDFNHQQVKIIGRFTHDLDWKRTWEFQQGILISIPVYFTHVLDAIEYNSVAQGYHKSLFGDDVVWRTHPVQAASWLLSIQSTDPDGHLIIATIRNVSTGPAVIRVGEAVKICP